MRLKLNVAAIVTNAAALMVASTAAEAGSSAVALTPQGPTVTIAAMLEQPADAGLDGTLYATTEAIVDTGWQMAEGAYYLGGEVLESGRILGAQFGSILGLWTARTGAANEDAHLRAWTGTGEEDLTPSLPTSASTLVEPESGRAAMRQPPISPAPPAMLQRASLGGGSAQTAGSSCSWPALGQSQSHDTEAAVIAELTDLRLLDEPAIRLPDGAVFLPKVTQRLLQIRTGYPCEGAVTPSRTLVGHVIADPTTSGLVQASYDGRFEAAPWGLPRLGQRVTEGEVLGYLRPIWSNRDRAETEAQIATLRGEIAEKELELARSRELPMLPFRQGRILSIRLELDKLRRQRDALVEGLEGTKAVLATASGVIARADARVGQVVLVQHLLWEIVDERRLWVEAGWFGGEPPTSIPAASAMRPDGTSLSLVYEGGGWAMNAQSTPLQFRVDSPMPGLRIGEPVTVLVRERLPTDGVLVPRSALTRRSNGEAGVWVATQPERFEPYRVRWKPVDGSTVVIEAGLPDGARVVISGAALLSEVR